MGILGSLKADILSLLLLMTSSTVTLVTDIFCNSYVSYWCYCFCHCFPITDWSVTAIVVASNYHMCQMLSHFDVYHCYSSCNFYFRHFLSLYGWLICQYSECIIVLNFCECSIFFDTSCKSWNVMFLSLLFLMSQQVIAYFCIYVFHWQLYSFDNIFALLLQVIAWFFTFLIFL